MPRTTTDIREGMVVRSADGEKLGKVSRLFGDSFEIEKGFFFPREYVARMGDVSQVKGDEIYLGIRKAELEDWNARGGATRGATGGPGFREETRVPLAEEQLVVEKTRRQAGEVEVRKDVVTEHRQIEVPVTRETVTVERRPAGEAPHGGEAEFEKGTIRVPIEEEEVEVRKRPVVREEVVVGKERHVEERTASGDLRRETVEVRREGEHEKNKKW